MTSSPPDASRRQKRMGPAPFASFEDLSDEVRSRLESPEDKNMAGSVVRLPGIREDTAPTTPALTEIPPSPAVSYKGISLIGAINNPVSTQMASIPLKMTIKPPATPRIDISRASSSSHHDSRDSSPEREIFDAHDPNSAKLGLGFKEDGALDLRSSTEELDFQEITEKKKCKPRPQSPSNQDESSHMRKDSQCSDIVLLSISGRTSRLSSIGSQGSGQSRLSNASHISVLSGQSALSRSSSPHKLVLETSFCGTKPPDKSKINEDQRGTKVETEDMEKILLSRKHDPTEAIIAEGITVDTAKLSKPKNQPEKPVRKNDVCVQNVKSDITITVDEPRSDSNNKIKIPSKFVSESGVEYFYIPLKGPLPVEPASTAPKQKSRETNSTNCQSRNPVNNNITEISISQAESKSATPSTSNSKKEEPKYIRIKLKPDRCYFNEAPLAHEIHKPDTLELEKYQNTSNYIHDLPKRIKAQPENSYLSKDLTSIRVTPNGSPNLPRDGVTAESNIETITPSPSVSRKSSFTSLFKSKDAVISPESPSIPCIKRKNTLTGIFKDSGDNPKTRSRSRSKSRDRDSHKSSVSTAPSSTESIDSKSKHKSVLSLFKSSKKNKLKCESETSSQEILPSIEGIVKVEFQFNDAKINKTYYENPLESASIRIPLHSPTYYENQNNFQDWKTSSQDSQETVIEAAAKNFSSVVEPVTQHEEICVNKSENKTTVGNKKSRQSSTSSENVIFSTNLGNDNEVFSTKLPKQKPNEAENKPIVVNGFDDAKNLLKEDIAKTKESEATENSNNKILMSKSIINVKEVEPKLEANILIDKRISQISVGALSSISSVASSNTEEDHYSSESERDPEEFSRIRKDLDLKLDLENTESERKAIVLQQDSFEDELPYIPTTLPLERSTALPIVTVKQRSTFEIKTCPIGRPRSTTPINPSCLEEYCEEVMGSFDIESVTKTIEKLKISLPRNESFDKPNKVKSPRKKDSNTNWFEFAEKGISVAGRTTVAQTNDTPPPLPPKGIQKAWINFEDIPEKRKAPKRIQTIPSRSYIEVPESVLQESVVYNYVNPDECKCECHEMNAKDREKRSKESHEIVQEDELPLLEDDIAEDDKTGSNNVDQIRPSAANSDCQNIISNSPGDLSIGTHRLERNDIEKPAFRTPFTSNLGLSSNKSSTISQEHQPPGTPNAFPKIS